MIFRGAARSVQQRSGTKITKESSVVMQLLQILSMKVNFICLNVGIKAIDMRRTHRWAFKSLLNSIKEKLSLPLKVDSQLKMS